MFLTIWIFIGGKYNKDFLGLRVKKKKRWFQISSFLGKFKVQVYYLWPSDVLQNDWLLEEFCCSCCFRGFCFVLLLLFSDVLTWIVKICEAWWGCIVGSILQMLARAHAWESKRLWVSGATVAPGVCNHFLTQVGKAFFSEAEVQHSKDTGGRFGGYFQSEKGLEPGLSLRTHVHTFSSSISCWLEGVCKQSFGQLCSLSGRWCGRWKGRGFCMNSDRFYTPSELQFPHL